MIFVARKQEQCKAEKQKSNKNPLDCNAVDVLNVY